MTRGTRGVRGEPLRVLLVGCGRRGMGVYAPVLSIMTDHFQVVGTCDIDPDRARAAATVMRAEAYTDLLAAIEHTRPDLAVVAVSPPPSHANGEALATCVAASCHVLAETPIAKTAREASDLLDAVPPGLVVEIAENYYRTPVERLKRACIDAGTFGVVKVAYSDFVGHGYHGIALLRAHIGFDVPVVRVHGSRQDFEVHDHLYREGERRDAETWQFGEFEFRGGARGIFSFTTLSYGSPLRWGRDKASLRFLATKGMGLARDWATLDGAGNTLPLTISEVRANVDGCDVLAALRIDELDITWENPLRTIGLKDGDQHAPLTIGLVLHGVHQAITLGTAVEYGIQQAWVDRCLDLAMMQSWSNGSVPVTFGDAWPDLESLA